MGVLSNDIVIGGLILLTGLLNGYFAGEGKRSNYILGFINYVLMAYVSFKNHLYGMTIFYTCIFAPLQIKGFLEWNKTLDEENNVIVREFTLKNSVIITISCILGSFILGYLSVFYGISAYASEPSAGGDLDTFLDTGGTLFSWLIDEMGVLIDFIMVNPFLQIFLLFAVCGAVIGFLTRIIRSI